MLDSVVISGEGRRPEQVHGPVRADQAAAGEGRCRREEDGQQTGRHAGAAWVDGHWQQGRDGWFWVEGHWR